MKDYAVLFLSVIAILSLFGVIEQKNIHSCSLKVAIKLFLKSFF